MTGAPSSAPPMASVVADRSGVARRWAERGLCLGAAGLLLQTYGEFIAAYRLPVTEAGLTGTTIASQFLLHLALVLAALMVGVRFLTPVRFAAAVLVAWSLRKAGLLDFALHDLFSGMDWYVAWLGDTGGKVNPQWLKLMLFAVLLPLLGLRLVRRRDRSLDRIFVAVAVGAVLTTTFLFHQVIVSGSYRAALDQRRELLIQATFAAPEVFASLCRRLDGATCLDQPRDQPVAGLGKALDDTLNRMIAHLNAQPQRNSFYAMETPGLLDSNVLSMSMAAMRLFDDRLRVVVDSGGLNALNRLHVALFSLLAVVAHTVWLLGATGLLWLHRYRFLARRRR